MYRKRVTCELRDSYFRSMMIKHAIPKTAEVAYSVGQLWEEIAWAWRRVHISAWEFDGKYKVDELNRRQWKIPLFTQACPVVTSCAFPRPSSNLHRRVKASWTNYSNTSPDCSYFTQASVEKMSIYCYIYHVLWFVWPERNVTWSNKFSLFC